MYKLRIFDQVFDKKANIQVVQNLKRQKTFGRTEFFGITKGSKGSVYIARTNNILSLRNKTKGLACDRAFRFLFSIHFPCADFEFPKHPICTTIKMNEYDE